MSNHGTPSVFLNNIGLNDNGIFILNDRYLNVVIVSSSSWLTICLFSSPVVPKVWVPSLPELISICQPFFNPHHSSHSPHHLLEISSCSLFHQCLCFLLLVQNRDTPPAVYISFHNLSLVYLSHLLRIAHLYAPPPQALSQLWSALFISHLKSCSFKIAYPVSIFKSNFGPGKSNQTSFSLSLQGSLKNSHQISPQEFLGELKSGVMDERLFACLDSLRVSLTSNPVRYSAPTVLFHCFLTFDFFHYSNIMCHSVKMLPYCIWCPQHVWMHVHVGGRYNDCITFSRDICKTHISFGSCYWIYMNSLWC